MVTAKSWDLIPSEFDKLGLGDQVEMLALEECLAKVQQFEADESKRNQKKGNKPSFVIE